MTEYTNDEKYITEYTNGEKHITEYTNEEKHITEYTNEEKHIIEYTNEKKYMTTYANNEKYITEYTNEEKYMTTFVINSRIQIMLENILEYIKNNSKSKENVIKYYDVILEEIEKLFTSENYDTSNIDKGIDEIIGIEKMNITFTTIQNQKNKINENITIVDLEECEFLLREFYNISNNKIIYIKKLDIFQEGINKIKVEYNVYNRLSGKNLIKLNLSVCENSKISLFIPAIISENIDKLNSSSGYFNDVCYTSTSDSGTDISLEDRKIEFVEGNKGICQEDCIFLEYNYTSKKAKCSCKVKESSSSFANMKINKTKLYENFLNFKNIANIKILRCFGNLFSKIGLLKNIGSYIIIVIFILHIVFIVIFYKNQLKKVRKMIEDIIYAIKNYSLTKIRKKRKSKKSVPVEIIQENKGEIKNNNRKKRNRKSLFLKRSSKRIMDEAKSDEDKNIPGKLKSTFMNINNQNINNNINININNNNNDDPSKKRNTNILNNDNLTNNSKKRRRSKKTIEGIKNILDYSDKEKNEFSYELALQYDKRTYCQYYISLLKEKHIFIFAFFNNNDYNSRIIKIDSFFNEFSTFYIVNALFYDDNTMHNIYIKKGSFDLEYQLPKIVYSSLISLALNTLLRLLYLSSNDIIRLKKIKTQSDVDSRGVELNKKLSIKFCLYFILNTILLLCFWYYISMFGAIYRNTQLYLLKDTLISYGLGLIYPFGIYLLPGIIRIPSLSRQDKECLYNFSKFLQIL